MPFALIGPPGCGIVFPVQGRQFALQFEVASPTARVNAFVGERLLHGTPRLGLVGAIGEAAAGEQPLKVAEHLLHSLLGVEEPETADTRSVHEHCTASQRHQLPGGGGVPSLTVTGTHLTRFLEIASGEGVDER